MQVRKIYLCYFSPTQGSEKIIHAMAQSMPEAEFIDLTRETKKLNTFHSDDLLIVGAPVYGGNLPAIAVDRFKELRGDHTLAVPLVVYGNRDFGNALNELSDLLHQQGFRTIGAATFVGRHSYSTAEYPVAHVRPDDEDLLYAKKFGQEILKKIQEAADQPGEVDTHKMKHQMHWRTMPGMFVDVLKMKLKKECVPSAPTVENPEKCTHCARCVNVCPNQAIVKGDEIHILADRCIRCCACVNVCPQKIRAYNTPFSRILWRNARTPQKPQHLL